MDNAPVILIGGVGGGLGSAVAERALLAGWRVAGYGRRPEPRVPGAVSYMQADVIQVGDVDRVVRETLGRFGRVDAYVHAIGSIHLNRPT